MFLRVSTIDVGHILTVLTYELTRISAYEKSLEKIYVENHGPFPSASCEDGHGE